MEHLRIFGLGLAFTVVAAAVLVTVTAPIWLAALLFGGQAAGAVCLVYLALMLFYLMGVMGDAWHD